MIKQTYIERHSIVHELDFWTKFICLLIILPLASFLINIEYLGFLLLFLFVLVIASKIGFGKFWREVRHYIVPITLGLTLLSLVFSEGNINQRLFSGLALAIRFSLLISYGFLFSMVTNPVEIPAGFMRAKIPHKYGVTLMVGYRMMPLLTNKITTIIQAQKARGASFRFSIKKIKKFFLQLTSLIVPLLHSTLEMSVRLSDALISRGYNPDKPITIPKKKWSVYDFGFTVFSMFALIISLL
jgi:energy-coupling factor transporter transmembrane protein EcfT